MKYHKLILTVELDSDDILHCHNFIIPKALEHLPKKEIGDLLCVVGVDFIDDQMDRLSEH